MFTSAILKWRRTHRDFPPRPSRGNQFGWKTRTKDTSNFLLVIFAKCFVVIEWFPPVKTNFLRWIRGQICGKRSTLADADDFNSFQLPLSNGSLHIFTIYSHFINIIGISSCSSHSTQVKNHQGDILHAHTSSLIVTNSSFNSISCKFLVGTEKQIAKSQVTFLHFSCAFLQLVVDGKRPSWHEWFFGWKVPQKSSSISIRGLACWLNDAPKSISGGELTNKTPCLSTHSQEDATTLNNYFSLHTDLAAVNKYPKTSSVILSKTFSLADAVTLQVCWVLIDHFFLERIKVIAFNETMSGVKWRVLPKSLN